MLRLEFAYKHREQILVLAYQREKRYKEEGFNTKMTHEEERLVDKLRSEVGYSCKTISYDIFHNLVNLLKKSLIANKTHE